MPSSPDFRPTATWEMLQVRARLMRQLRGFFHERGFTEVETPLLSRDSVVDLHLDPIPVEVFHDARRPSEAQRMWLQTSPEFAMKRLLAAGADRIFQVTKAFRAGERGTRHNPEFTMVEWYRVGDDLQQGMNLLAQLARHMLAAEEVDFVTYRDAFQQFAGLDPHQATIDELQRSADACRVSPPHGLNDRDDWLNFLLAEIIEPQLGRHRPTILFDYPASQAALARTRKLSDDPQTEVAERFELYVAGIELANGYHELLDATILRDRNRAANAKRLADGRYAIPEESRLLDAMENGLPNCSGVALGFDRLVMHITGATDIAEVIPFPLERA